MFDAFFTLLIVCLAIWLAVNCFRLVRLPVQYKTDDDALAKVRRRKLKLVLGALAILIVTLAGLPLVGLMWPKYTHIARPETGCDFPAIPDIAGMKASRWYVQGQTKSVEFQVPEHCWGDILAALTPSERDSWPCKWMVLADLDLRTKGGQSCYVGLYSLRDEPVGAFSAGPSFEERVYYRGGNSRQLNSALARAYAEFMKKNTQQGVSAKSPSADALPVVPAAKP